MSFEDLLRDWDGEQALVKFDPPTGTWMFICMHSTRLGPAIGGTRMKVYPSPADALADDAPGRWDDAKDGRHGASVRGRQGGARRPRPSARQGVGEVGARLAELLTAEGATVIVSDVAEERVRELCERLGVASVPPEDVVGTECDVFAPCAVGGVLNEESIGRLRCRVVAGAANNQLARP
jgi:glutamate dehydrogenase/leucine dehydrogenase